MVMSALSEGKSIEEIEASLNTELTARAEARVAAEEQAFQKQTELDVQRTEREALEDYAKGIKDLDFFEYNGKWYQKERNQLVPLNPVDTNGDGQPDEFYDETEQLRIPGELPQPGAMDNVARLDINSLPQNEQGQLQFPGGVYAPLIETDENGIKWYNHPTYGPIYPVSYTHLPLPTIYSV